MASTIIVGMIYPALYESEAMKGDPKAAMPLYVEHASLIRLVMMIPL